MHNLFLTFYYNTPKQTAKSRLITILTIDHLLSWHQHPPVNRPPPPPNLLCKYQTRVSPTLGCKVVMKIMMLKQAENMDGAKLLTVNDFLADKSEGFLLSEERYREISGKLELKS